MRSKGSNSRKAAGSGKMMAVPSLKLATHFVITRERIADARTAWDKAQREWFSARATLRGANPLVEDYENCVNKLQRATERYVAASQNLLKVCERA